MLSSAKKTRTIVVSFKTMIVTLKKRLQNLQYFCVHISEDSLDIQKGENRHAEGPMESSSATNH